MCKQNVNKTQKLAKTQRHNAYVSRLKQDKKTRISNNTFCQTSTKYLHKKLKHDTFI